MNNKHMINKNNGFSLVELMIDLVVISCIIAAFAPVITKKIQNNALGITNYTSSCAKFGPSCKFCNSRKCLSCQIKHCDRGIDVAQCKCNGEYCNDENFMKIDGLCVTKKNMGDSDDLPLPNTITVAEAGNPADACNSSETNLCCWQGPTANQSQCDSANGGYSGCNRTVCDWWAANEACSKFHFAGYKWKLANSTQLNNFNPSTNSANKGISGLQLCDMFSGYGSARCHDAYNCSGVEDDNCVLASVWGAESSSTRGYNYYLDKGAWTQYSTTKANARSPRCITDETECATGYYKDGTLCNSCLDAISNCASCSNATTCTSCEEGYGLVDGKCVRDWCSGDKFMKIGKLCVTKYNIGDGGLAIPASASVTTISATTDGSQSCTPSEGHPCCWQAISANTATQCIVTNGNYLGCKRTVCDWWAANNICSKFNYGGYKWRLPTAYELQSWEEYSANLGSNGLMICNTGGNLGLAHCRNGNTCYGSGPNLYNQELNGCGAHGIWSMDQGGVRASALVSVNMSTWIANDYKRVAFSVRCVAEIDN